MPVAQRQVELRHQLLHRLSEARANTDQLFSIVKPEALYDRPIPERHRIIFYIGHLEAFDWNLLRERALSLGSFHPDFDKLFAFGIDPVGGGLPTDQPSDWPTNDAVKDYVAEARQTLDEALEDQLAEAQSGHADLTLLLQVAIEHRLMHAETLAYMLHQLPTDRKIRPNAGPEVVITPVQSDMVRIPAGRVTLGLSRNDPNTFGWDNEFEAHTGDVPAFSIDRHMVTNRDFLSFMTAGGYDSETFWSKEDWAWKTTAGVSHPGFWLKRDNAWHQRTMFSEIPLPLDWPVYVSQAEASAYATWAGKTLPTEAQWQRAAYGTPEGDERQYPWGSEPPSTTRGNFDFRRWDPTPVGAFPEGANAFGVTDLAGNGWEWTSTPFGPFPGFEPFPFYRGYSADFFDNKHFVMKGGSPRTAASMLRRSFRNWFQSHYPYVYAGFRCVSH
jgi:ergothioneine biosynthesis protein EgtB